MPRRRRSAPPARSRACARAWRSDSWWCSPTCSPSSTSRRCDMGTPERRARVDADVRDGLPARMRRGGLRAALLVDRDGVLVEDRPFIAKLEDLVLLPGAGAALARCNQLRMPTALITNQPVIARGELDEEQLHALHTLLEDRKSVV